MRKLLLLTMLGLVACGGSDPAGQDCWAPEDGWGDAQVSACLPAPESRPLVCMEGEREIHRPVCIHYDEASGPVFDSVEADTLAMEGAADLQSYCDGATPYWIFLPQPPAAEGGDWWWTIALVCTSSADSIDSCEALATCATAP